MRRMCELSYLSSPKVNGKYYGIIVFLRLD